MGYIAFVLNFNKVAVDHTLEHDRKSDADDEAIKIVKSLPRGRPYEIRIFNTETKEEIGKRRKIHGERFNENIRKFEEAVNIAEKFKTTREGRIPINSAQFGFENFSDPRRQSSGMEGIARDDYKRK